MTPLTAATLLMLLSKVATTLREFSQQLRLNPAVTRVDRRCEIEDGERPSIEWYVDAEISNGEALSFRLLLYWHREEWIIESEVRRVHKAGSEVEFELPTRYALDDDLQEELNSATSQLASSAKKIRFSA